MSTETRQSFNRQALNLDVQDEVEKITEFLREEVLRRLRKQGAVVGISGGIDSAVVLALSVRAFGANRVVGILLPEKESSPESAELAHLLANQYGVQTVTEDITPALEGLGCYQRRDEAIKRVFPEFESSWKSKIVLPGNLLEEDRLNVFSLTVIKPDGSELTRRLPLQEFAQIVAASNFKQRTRMAMLYYHAESRNYAVIGTPNKNEHDLGFFVKYGDGGTDVNPIAHLYKTQVYQLAQFLDIPKAIQERPPTTDTYPAGSTQEEFFYRIPFHILDFVWLGYEKQVPIKEIAETAELSEEQVQRVIADIERKKRATQYLRTHPAYLE